MQPALFEADAEVTRVVADLSDIGEPQSVPLTGTGDGAWRLVSPLTPRGPTGRRVSVLIEQATSLGPYWARLSQEIAVWPAADLSILDEGPAAGWQINGRGGAQVGDLRQRARVHTGDVAAAFQVAALQRTWELVLTPPAPIDTLGFRALRLAFHPGDVKEDRLNSLGLWANDRGFVDLIRGEHSVDVGQPVWQAVEIPLAELVGRDETAIYSLHVRGNLVGTFFLDGMRLLMRAARPVTAVEAGDETVPQSLALEQNYPNPFNAGTSIRFALPTAGEIDLVLYNLAGQPVATLVEGVRPAGAYALQWDGRDEAGRVLASGV